MDLLSRIVIGWSAKSTIRCELVRDAVESADVTGVSEFLTSYTEAVVLKSASH